MSRILFTELGFGRITLKNRIVMSPMTRNRAIGGVPNALMARYYALRSDAGLIVTEGTGPSPNGMGYIRMPGLYAREHREGWKEVTDAVHANGGRIFVQLMHTGRVGHPLNLPSGARVLAPSAIRLSGTIHTDANGLEAYPEPEAMTEQDIARTLDEFAQASRMAIDAGFDGVELHGANGYLIDQFLNTTSNRRDDRWGAGNVEDRSRFALAVASRVGEAIGFDRVGMRLSPYGVLQEMAPDAKTDATHERLARELGELGLLYLHIADFSAMGTPPVKPELKRAMRERFKGHFISSGGYDSAEKAAAALTDGDADLIAVGRPFISNPDLVARFKSQAALKPFDPSTFYTSGEEGYLDY